MTEAEYRAHPAVSRSELWRLRDSPQKFKYFREHPPEPTPSLLFGQVFHKMVLEPDTFGDGFAVAPGVDRRTRDGKSQWEEFTTGASGKIVVPSEMYSLAKAMRDSVMAEPFAAKLLLGEREVPFFWAEDDSSEACKCRVDCLNTNLRQPIVVDLKSTTDASTEGFTKSAIQYGYDFQAAMYSEGVERNIMERPLFVFIAVEKEPPYAVNILQADELFLRRGERIFRELVGVYHDCKLTGNWYGYLGKKNQINNLALPSWLARDVE